MNTNARKQNGPKYKKRFCPFSQGKVPASFIDCKNVRFLLKYIGETGKIVPSRITGVKNIYQHKLTRAIKQARFLALIPYCHGHDIRGR